MQKIRTAVSAATATALALGFASALAPLATARTAAAPAAAAPAAPAAGGTAQKVIVLLRNQHAGLASPEIAGAVSPRALAFAADQSPVVAAARALGVRTLTQFSIINGFAATMTAAQQSALTRNPAVSAVLPDLQIRRPTAVDPEAAALGAVGGTVDAASAVSTGACPANPRKPLLEPEALQTMHVAYDTSQVGAQSYTTGAGVKVAFMAEGIDVNNKDLIRPDGSRVIVDYKDFSGDGLAAPTGGAEAFGDASSIAAQGRHTYDLSTFVNPAHPLPAGCTIKVRGVAPGASLVALKIFGQVSAYASGFVEAIQYAVHTAKVDVLSQSFGGNPYPDTSRDPISLADDAAVAAGVTVVVSTGDSAGGNTIGSPASDPNVISAAASTTLRIEAQTGQLGTQLSSGRWADNNIAGLSSGGATESGKVPDVVAPGQNGWALCTPDLALYADCSNYAGNPSSLEDFGGTSESAPLTAGTAALVIAAYAKTHHGLRPSPALVKRIITSTAQDLGHPADQQGSGEVDALAAVRLARSVPTENARTAAVPGTAVGSSLLVDKTQLDLSGVAGSAAGATVRVTNVSRRPTRISATTRSLTKVVATATGVFTFNASRLPILLNVAGAERAYTVRTFHVGKGIDRLDATIAAPVAPDGYIYLALISPTGIYTAYSEPQGVDNFGTVNVRYPAAGTWKAVILSRLGFSGRLAYRFTTSDFTRLGTASPAAFTLAPGASRTVTLRMPFTAAPGDRFASLQLASSSGNRVSVPVSLRAVVPATSKHYSFTGVIDHANGRPGSPAQSDTYYVDVPAGKPGLSVGVRLSGSANELLTGYLVSPAGQALSDQTNVRLTTGGSLITVRALQMFRTAPAPGRWKIVLAAANPLAGLQTSQAFEVTVGYGPADVAVVGKLPASPAVKLAVGSTVTRRIRVTNNGVAPLVYFADPRRAGLVRYKLASQVPGDNLQAEPLPATTQPDWLVPTETRALSIHARATVPVQLDASYGGGNPEQLGTLGTASDVRFSGVQLTPGVWFSLLDQPGPFGPSGAPTGTAKLSAVVTTRAFDSTVLSSTGDFWRSALIAPGGSGVVTSAVPGTATGSTSAATQPWLGATSAPSGPLVLDPGQTGYIDVAIQAKGRAGDVIRGTIFVDTVDVYSGSGDEVVGLPYAYTVR